MREILGALKPLMTVTEVKMSGSNIENDPTPLAAKEDKTPLLHTRQLLLS